VTVTLNVQFPPTAMLAPASEMVFPPLMVSVPPQVLAVLLVTDMPI
jgi:hypothetical protein